MTIKLIRKTALNLIKHYVKMTYLIDDLILYTMHGLILYTMYKKKELLFILISKLQLTPNFLKRLRFPGSNVLR